MMNFAPLIAALENTPLADWAQILPQQIAEGLCEKRFGDLPAWKKSLAKLPSVATTHIELGKEAR
jgi:tRNA (mo5U34)-methyltransferase